MARPRRDDIREETQTAIKDAARAQMREHGTAGLTLRGVARILDLTAPAIYNYYPRLEDLITALIVDAFNALADYVAAAADPDDDVYIQFVASALAYRQWAVTNSTDFQLIYGNPIPGYAAPPEITVPLARRPLEHFGRLLVVAEQAGRVRLSAAYCEPPATVNAHLAEFLPGSGIPMSAALFYMLMVGWTRIHGLVVLELFGHTTPALGDPAAAYSHEVKAYLFDVGIGVGMAERRG